MVGWLSAGRQGGGLQRRHRNSWPGTLGAALLAAFLVATEHGRSLGAGRGCFRPANNKGKKARPLEKARPVKEATQRRLASIPADSCHRLGLVVASNSTIDSIRHPVGPRPPTDWSE